MVLNIPLGRWVSLKGNFKRKKGLAKKQKGKGWIVFYTANLPVAESEPLVEPWPIEYEPVPKDAAVDYILH